MLRRCWCCTYLNLCRSAKQARAGCDDCGWRRQPLCCCDAPHHPMADREHVCAVLMRAWLRRLRTRLTLMSKVGSGSGRRTDCMHVAIARHATATSYHPRHTGDTGRSIDPAASNAKHTSCRDWGKQGPRQSNRCCLRFLVEHQTPSLSPRCQIRARAGGDSIADEGGRRRWCCCP